MSYDLLLPDYVFDMNRSLTFTLSIRRCFHSSSLGGSAGEKTTYRMKSRTIRRNDACPSIKP